MEGVRLGKLGDGGLRVRKRGQTALSTRRALLEMEGVWLGTEWSVPFFDTCLVLLEMDVVWMGTGGDGGLRVGKRGQTALSTRRVWLEREGVRLGTEWSVPFFYWLLFSLAGWWGFGVS